MTGIVYDNPIPRPLKVLGARWRDGRRSYRMQWGELSFGRRGWAISLCLFGEMKFSLHLHAFWTSVYITLPFLRRFAWEPDEMMESWGASYVVEPNALHLSWGRRYKIITMPWRDLVHISHEVRRPDGSWVPAVGSWEPDKEPDGRHTESFPYSYLLEGGEVQQCVAQVHVERRVWRLRWLCWTRHFQKMRHYIDVAFSEEMGERRGSWKGGTVGCSYDLRPNETPRECLKRMEKERRFR